MSGTPAFVSFLAAGRSKMARKKPAPPSRRSKTPPIKEQERLRHRFRPLVLQNPNYFGNLQDSEFESELKLSELKSYEEIGCVGYQPRFERLEAVVFIHRKSGYNGGVCTDGSTEFIRFYLSYDGGATWDDQGLSSFTAYDIPENDSRLEYAVSRTVDPPRRFCFIPNLIRARAILSWNQAPPQDQPDWKPVWGDVHDTWIEVEPWRLFALGDLFDEIQIDLPGPLKETLDLATTVPSKKKTLSLAEKAELYKGTDVKPARFALQELDQLVHKPILSASLPELGPPFALPFPELDLDLPDLGDLFNPGDGNVSYEELECVGFDGRTDTLVGILRVKKPNGYSGGACTDGSQEYVTFWADVNGNGTFETCLGTASVTVHDYDEIPDEGLEYSVFLKTDLRRYQQPCRKGARLMPIRAILSWAVPAPCFNPNHVPVWGNREETVIHIPAGRVVQGSLPVIASVGDMATPDIAADGYATGSGVETGFAAEYSPFGGRIDIAGKIVGGTASSKYRVMVKPHGAPDTDYVPVTVEPTGLKLTLVTVVGTVVTIDTDHVVHADAQGYYPYEDYASNHFIDGNILMRWHTGGAEDGQAFDLRVDLSVDGNPLNDIHSDVVTVHVDNDAPEATLDINLGGTGATCADFGAGTVFDGNFSATDAHFRRFWFSILPGGPANGVLPTPTSPTVQWSEHVIGVGGLIDPGVPSGTYQLNTSGMDPCGYSLTVWVESRTNVNSGVGRRRDSASVGFCVRAPED